MSLSESQVWGHFFKAWPHHCERQEPGIGAGQPDVALLDIDGKRGLVELKRPSKVKLRTSQWAWHERDQRNGGKSCVVTCMNVKGKIMWRVFSVNIEKHKLERLTDWCLPQQMNDLVADYLGLDLV